METEGLRDELRGLNWSPAASLCSAGPLLEAETAPAAGDQNDHTSKPLCLFDSVIFYPTTGF